MTSEIRHGALRFRCDYCKHLIDWRVEPVTIHDTVTGLTHDVCSHTHAALWFAREYQLELPFGNPFSNTGVILTPEPQNE